MYIYNVNFNYSNKTLKKTSKITKKRRGFLLSLKPPPSEKVNVLNPGHIPPVEARSPSPNYIISNYHQTGIAKKQPGNMFISGGFVSLSNVIFPPLLIVFSTWFNMEAAVAAKSWMDNITHKSFYGIKKYTLWFQRMYLTCSRATRIYQDLLAYIGYFAGMFEHKCQYSRSYLPRIGDHRSISPT